MNLIAIETPAARVAPTRKPLKLLDAPLRIVAPSQLLQVIADQLIETLTEGLSLLASAFHNLFVN